MGSDPILKHILLILMMRGKYNIIYIIGLRKYFFIFICFVYLSKDLAYSASPPAGVQGTAGEPNQRKKFKKFSTKTFYKMFNGCDWALKSYESVVS